MVEYVVFCPSCGHRAHYDPSNSVSTCLDRLCGTQYKTLYLGKLAEDDPWYDLEEDDG